MHPVLDHLLANEECIGDRPAVILRNHGLLTWGDTIARAFAFLWLLTRASDITLAPAGLGPAIPIPDEIQRKCTQDAMQYQPQFRAGQDAIDALTRIIDRIDPSYRN